MDGSVALNRRISMEGMPPDQTSDECIICCERITDKAFVGDCLHYFCFRCLKQWTLVRAVCPLCVQPITSIINNVRSADDYDIQAVQPPATDVLSNGDYDSALWDSMSDDDDDDDDYDEVNYLGTPEFHSDTLSDDELEEYLQVSIDHFEDGDADAETSDDEDGHDAFLESGSDIAESVQYVISETEEEDEDTFLDYGDSDMVESGNYSDNASDDDESVSEQHGSISDGNDSVSEENGSTSEEDGDVSDVDVTDLSCAYDSLCNYSDDEVYVADYNSEDYYIDDEAAISDDDYYCTHDDMY